MAVVGHYVHVADSDGGLAILRFASGEDVSITACKQNTEGAAVKDWLMTLAGPEPQAGQTLANGCITWTVTQPGAYTVTEADRAGWTPRGAASADFTVVSGGGPYSHTFVNFQDVPITACKQDTEGRGGQGLADDAGGSGAAGEPDVDEWLHHLDGDAARRVHGDRGGPGGLDASRCGERRLHGGLGRRSLQPHLRQLPGCVDHSL